MSTETWICEKCRHAGPPNKGPTCVLCPACGHGKYMPRYLFLQRKAEEEAKEIRKAGQQVIDAFRIPRPHTDRGLWHSSLQGAVHELAQVIKHTTTGRVPVQPIKLKSITGAWAKFEGDTMVMFFMDGRLAALADREEGGVEVVHVVRLRDEAAPKPEPETKSPRELLEAAESAFMAAVRTGGAGLNYQKQTDDLISARNALERTLVVQGEAAAARASALHKQNCRLEEAVRLLARIVANKAQGGIDTYEGSVSDILQGKGETT